MSAQLLNNCDRVKTSSGETWTRSYYCDTDEDLQNIEPNYGDLADWTPKTARITRVHPVSLVGIEGVPPYTLTLEASTKLGSSSSSDSYNNYKSYTGDVARHISYAEAVIRPEWFGIKKATKKDAGWVTIKTTERVPVSKTGDNDYQEVKIEHRIEDKAKLNLSGDHCQEGDYIYKNATKDNKGSVNYEKCPYKPIDLESDALNNFLKKILENPQQTTVFDAQFYSSKDVNSFEAFRGVNPSEDAFPRNHKPKQTAEGYWKAEMQDLAEVTDQNSAKKTKVYRKIVSVPNVPGYKLRFDPDKNGGTWSWIT